MSKPKISFLSEDEIERIHKASLEVLGNTGIKDIPYCGRMNFYLV